MHRALLMALASAHAFHAEAFTNGDRMASAPLNDVLVGLQEFVEKFTQLNRGRAYFADLENLGSYVLKDFVRNRRKRVR